MKFFRGSTTKSRGILSLVFSVLLVISVAAGLCLNVGKVSASTGKVLYYVDCGHMVDELGQLGDRGTAGRVAADVNERMRDLGLSFPTSTTIGAGELYNGFNDKLFGTDEKSGKKWGFTEYADYESWGYGPTTSTADGFNSARFVESSKGVPLEYKFEVDDDTTDYKLIMGFRVYKGWGSKKATVQINGATAVAEFNVLDSADTTKECTAKGVLSEADNKYYITLTLPVDGDDNHISFIQIQTADYVAPNPVDVYGKLYYFVDCGNLSETEDGLGGPSERDGNLGYPSKLVTPAMKRLGVSYPTSNNVELKQLYNSVTDQEFAVDAISGKSWGFDAYNDSNYWRFLYTGSNIDEYKTTRYINENKGEGTLKYTFEVDDDTTNLTVKMGFRMASGWTGKSNTVVINNAEKETFAVPDDKDLEKTFTEIKGVKNEEDGKYYVTISFKVDDNEDCVNFIQIQTANYVETQNVVYTASSFVEKGGVPQVKDDSGEIISNVSVSKEDAAIINAADPFSRVLISVKVNVGGIDTVIDNCAVTVLPSDIQYFINFGNVEKGQVKKVSDFPMKDDAAYTEELGYGYAEGFGGSSGWADNDYNKSIRYGSKLSFNFDVPNGKYIVYFGTFSPWLDGRTATYSFEGSEGIEYTYGTTALNFKDCVTVTDGQLNAEFNEVSDDDAVISYILVATIEDYYTVSYTVEGADAPYIVNRVEKGGFAEMPVEPEKAATAATTYTFIGWKNGSDAYNFTTPVTADLNLIADFDEITTQYVVTFDSDNGTNDAVNRVNYGSLLTKPTDPVKASTVSIVYTFDGWYNGDVKWDFENGTVTEDITLTAKYTETARTYTVTFNADNGSANTTAEIAYNGLVTAPAAPVKASTDSTVYTFDGWYNGEDEWDFESGKVTSAITLTAKYTETARTYTVTFNADNGSANTTAEIAYNGSVTAPVAPEKAETNEITYTFDGWYNGDAKWDFENGKVTSAITLTAKYTETARKYYVIFNAGNGSVNTTVEVAYNGSVTPPAAPEKEATKEVEYTFDGWYNGDEKWDFENGKVTKNITLTAKYTETPVKSSGCSGQITPFTLGGLLVACGLFVTVSILIINKKRNNTI